MQTTKNTQSLTATAQTFEALPVAVREELEAATLTATYAADSTLFSEGQPPRGIYLVRSGRVKLSLSASDGKTLILRIVEAGDVLGVASTLSGREYEATAETQERCEVSFLRRCDLLRLMRTHNEFALWVTELIGSDYSYTCREIRNLILSDSATAKLARLLLGWLDQHAAAHDPRQVRVALTHEEIGQMIGTSRETVTRLFAGFKKQRLIQQNGSMMLVPNRMALESLTTA